MDCRTSEILRKHGAKAHSAWRARRATTSLLFAPESRAYLWVTDRSGCGLVRR
ncbi:MAG: hypothetical protein PHU21_11500 [Elusimicrobia bacterium]|jgi:hypothetical protein|nr:hypothetical protein [Elusimicrobiota bacterium]